MGLKEPGLLRSKRSRKLSVEPKGQQKLNEVGCDRKCFCSQQGLSGLAAPRGMGHGRLSAASVLWQYCRIPRKYLG